MGKTSQTFLMAAALLVAAIGGGVVSSALAGRTSAPPPVAAAKAPAHEAEENTARAPARSGRDLALLAKVGELESRVDNLESSERPEGPGGAEEGQPMKTAEEYLAEHEDALEAHRLEPVDPAWARGTTPSFQMDIERVAEEVGFKVGKVECRSETCSAETKWDEFSSAKENYLRLLTTPFRANCARRIVFPEKGADEPVEGTLLLECADWKGGGSKLLELPSE